MSDIEKIKPFELKQINRKDNNLGSALVSGTVSAITGSTVSVENIDLFPDIVDEAINELYDAFGSDKLTKDTGLDCLKNNGITRIGIQDISEVTRYGREGENIKVVLKDGSQYEFVLKDGNHIIDAITLNDGTSIKCNLSDITQDAVRDLCGIYEHIEVKGHATLNINGVDMKLYWLEDDTKSLQDFIQFISTCREGLECFPSNVLKKVDESGFKGIFYGAAGSRDENMPDYAQNGYIAYASSDDFIFYASDQFRKDTITHEFSHVFDDSLVSGEGIKFSHCDFEFNELYEQYKKTIQPIIEPYTAYGNSNQYPDGVPTATEFFAVISSYYYNHGADLYELTPELYNYLYNFYNNI